MRNKYFRASNNNTVDECRATGFMHLLNIVEDF